MYKLLGRLVFTKWKDADKRSIAEGTFYSFIIQGLSVVLVFAGNLLLTRRAGAHDYGIYVHVFNWISILGVIAIAGRDDLVLSEITRYQVSGRPDLIGWLVRRTNRHIVTGSFLVIIAFLALIYYFPVPSLTQYRAAFLGGAIAIYFTAFLTLNQFILQSLNYIRLSQVVDKLVRPGLLMGGLLLASIAGLRTDYPFLIWLVVCIMAVCCALLGWLVYKRTSGTGAVAAQALAKTEAIGSPSLTDTAHLTRKSFLFFLITLLNLLVTKIVMLILPVFESVSAIGIFNICLRLSDLIIYPYFLMHSVLPQMFARHRSSDGMTKQSLYASATKMMTLLSLPLLAIICIAGKYLLGWFGPAFTSGYPALILLGISQFLYAFFGPANTILMMQDNERYAVTALLIYTMLLTGLSFWLIGSYGITGGALAMAIGSLVYNIVVAVHAYKVTGVISPWLKFMTPASGRGRKQAPTGPAEHS